MACNGRPLLPAQLAYKGILIPSLFNKYLGIICHSNVRSGASPRNRLFYPESNERLNESKRINPCRSYLVQAEG